jgi:hypothetical protein
MANVPHNVQKRSFGPGYLAWNAAGSTFNVRHDQTARIWRATAQRGACFYSAPSLRQLAMILDRDTYVADLAAPANGDAKVAALYLSWNDQGRRDRAETSFLA